jgi:hypothetical protein
MIFTRHVLAADIVETWRLWNPTDALWSAIEVLIETGATNARTEAANTGSKHKSAWRRLPRWRSQRRAVPRGRRPATTFRAAGHGFYVP